MRLLAGAGKCVHIRRPFPYGAVMRAIRFSEYGPPAQVLRLEDVPTPEPGAGEVRIHLTHRPINPSDLHLIAGTYGIRPKLPATPGLEGMGRIDALGVGVTGVVIGERVIAMAGGPGTWAEHLVVPAARIVPVPDAVSDQAAAQFVVNPLTAWVLLTEELALAQGDWVLQTAALSTLGRLVLQLARHRGLRTIGVVRRRDQVQELTDLGADAAICMEDERVIDRVKEITGGKGISGAIDSVGGSVAGELARSLRRGGTLVVFGLLGGDRVMPLDIPDLLFKGATVRGFWLTNWFATRPPERVGAAIAELMTLMAQGIVVPTVEAEYELADFASAIAHAERGGRQGKVLLRG